MNRIPTKLLICTGAATAAEFALVLPLFLILFFGIIDAGRFVWEYNEAEKAAQIGARVAIVTNVLAPGLRDENYAGKTVDGTVLAPGARIPAGALGVVKCDSSGCTCETAPCPADLGTFDSTTFNDVLVARMQQIDPRIAADNVEVRYSGSGLGFAGSTVSGGGGGGGGGSSETMEVSPLVTVTLKGLQFTPVTAFTLASISLPDLHTTLTAEDASGAYSN
jgi:hypothetical protein